MREFLDARLEELKPHGTFTGTPRRVGVVGLHEGRTLLVALGRTRHAVAAAGCDTEPRKIDEARRDVPGIFYTRDYTELLARPDVDIVAIYTPDSLHAGQIVQAFEAGKDVICTKPVVNSLKDAAAVLAAGRRTGRKLLVGQSTRFFEPFRRQRAAFEQGHFGDLELVDAHYVHRMDWYYEKSPWVATDTDWVFLGLSHPVDLVRWYLGPIETVQAFGTTSALGKRYGVAGFDIYTVNLRSGDGRLGRVMGHYGLKELPSARNCIELLLYGSRNSGLAQYHDMRYRYTRDDGTEVLEDPLYELRHYYFNSEIHGMHYGEFANYAEYFAASLIDGKPYSPGLEEAVETLCVMEAIRRSARGGMIVAVRDVMEELNHQAL
jgi:predicted dehydrogenase